MEENYIIGLIIAFLFSFVLLKKDKKAPETTSETVVRSLNEASGLSGVAKYLDSQNSSTQVSGVARYIQEKLLIEAEENDSQSVSGVAKYLAEKEEAPVSGVSKYMARQVIQTRILAKENVSGVEKYLNNQS